MRLIRTHLQVPFCCLRSVFNVAAAKIPGAKALGKNLASSLRSHTCGELRLEHVGTEVSLCGWVHRVRLGRFLLLRDTHGFVQIVLSSDMTKNKCSLMTESVVKVTGTVSARPERDVNKSLPTGYVEVLADNLVSLNTIMADLPFTPSDHRITNEPLRLSHRYLDLRNSTLQRNLKFRSDLTVGMRYFLAVTYGFLEIETPYLFKRTPGGAREFVTPTSYPGLFYSLPQSPQQFKQLLMIGGVDRYMQFARCFRDEPSRADRQPEFTQLDLEMSFVTSRDVMGVIEHLLASIWPLVQSFREDPLSLRFPFPKMSYSTAIGRYGSDKPDLRFGLELGQIEPDVAGFKIDSSWSQLFSSDDWENMQAQVRSLTGLAFSHSVVSDSEGSVCQLSEELEANQSDTVVYILGTTESDLKALGQVRLKVASLLHSKGVSVYEPGIHFLWVEDFPLFERTGPATWTSVHHPFTAPTPETEHFIHSDPARVIGQHYDLVCNGQEVGGGSIRIHDADLQEYILSNILKEDISRMGYFMEALRSGAPPHGGIALGLDRLIAILANANSIRDVIAFPKAANGKDLMCGAPAPISQQDLQHYSISLT